MGDGHHHHQQPLQHNNNHFNYLLVWVVGDAQAMKDSVRSIGPHYEQDCPTSGNTTSSAGSD